MELKTLVLFFALISPHGEVDSWVKRIENAPPELCVEAAMLAPRGWVLAETTNSGYGMVRAAWCE